MWALVLAAVELTIGVLLHGYRLKKTNIPKWAYALLELCSTLQFQHEDSRLGMGVFCLTIQPDFLTAAFPIQEAWAEQVILKTALLGPTAACEHRAAVRRFFELLEENIPGRAYRFLREKEPELTGGMLERPVVMLTLRIKGDFTPDRRYYQAAVLAAGKRLGTAVEAVPAGPYYDLQFSVYS